MEDRKRKREAAVLPTPKHPKGYSSNNNNKDPDPECLWAALPNEVAAHILSFLKKGKGDSKYYRSDDEIATKEAMPLICRLVCRQWRDLVPSPSKKV